MSKNNSFFVLLFISIILSSFSYALDIGYNNPNAVKVVVGQQSVVFNGTINATIYANGFCYLNGSCIGQGGFGETDPVWSSEKVNYYTSNQIDLLDVSHFTNNVGYITDGNTNWDNTYGFITGYTETDPYYFNNPLGYYNSSTLPAYPSETDSNYFNNPLGYYNSSTIPPSSIPDNTSWNETRGNAIYYPLSSNPYSYLNSSTLTETDPSVLEWKELISDPTGFRDTSETILAFNLSSYNFTITPTGSNYSYYVNGTKCTKTIDNITIPNSYGLHFVYYMDCVGLRHSLSPWGFQGYAQVAVIYLSPTGYILGDERHDVGMDWKTHEYLHNTIGTRYFNGLSGSFSNNVFNVTYGNLYDENLKITIPYQNSTNVLYRNSTIWQWVYNSSLYYYKNVTNMYYDNSGTLTAVPANQYMAVWIFGTNEPNLPIISILGQRVDTTLANARTNNNYESLSFGTLPFAEYKVLYRVIIRNDATPYEETQDLRSVSNVPSGTYVATSHGSLTGLTNDDHTQYLLANGGRDSNYLSTSNNSYIFSVVDNSSFYPYGTNPLSYYNSSTLPPQGNASWNESHANTLYQSLSNRSQFTDAVQLMQGNDSAWRTTANNSYARLDGLNQPFTGNITMRQRLNVSGIAHFNSTVGIGFGMGTPDETLDVNGSIKIYDNFKLYVGNNKYSSISYNGSDFVINPSEVGIRPMIVKGNVTADNLCYSNGSNCVNFDTNDTIRVEHLESYNTNQTSLSCPTDYYAYGYYTNGTPLCRQDVGSGGGLGDITAVYAGTGLTGGGTSSDVTLTLNDTYVTQLVGKKRTFGLSTDAGTSTITAGLKGYVTIPYNGYITKWYITADKVGNISVELWKDNNALPNINKNITNSSNLNLFLSALNSSAPNLWHNTTLVVGDVVAFNVTSAYNVSKITITVEVQEV